MANYSGNVDYLPVDDVDYTAEVTEMMGQASINNQARGARAAAMQSPTKMLAALWFLALLLYLFLGYFFRHYRV